MANDLTPPVTKGFWSRPEGVTGMLALGLGGVAGLIGLQYLLPIVLGVLTLGVAVVGKTILLAILCSILAAILMILSNKKFQALIGYIFKSSMRALTSIVVEIDPIGIMKNYIDDLKAKLREMDESISTLSGQISVCKGRVAKMEADRTKALNTAQVAKDKDMQSAFAVNARQAGRLQNSSVTLQQLLNTMELHLRALRKYREVSETVVLDMTNEVEVKSEERKMITASYGAMRSAMSILNGDPDKKELFDQAMEYVVTDYGMKLGEIENFMINSKSFVEGLDLQNGVYEADALASIQAWENKADSLLLGDSKRLMVENHISSVPQREVIIVDNEYDSFFKK